MDCQYDKAKTCWTSRFSPDQVDRTPKFALGRLCSISLRRFSLDFQHADGSQEQQRMPIPLSQARAPGDGAGRRSTSGVGRCCLVCQDYETIRFEVCGLGSFPAKYGINRINIPEQQQWVSDYNARLIERGRDAAATSLTEIALLERPLGGETK